MSNELDNERRQTVLSERDIERIIEEVKANVYCPAHEKRETDVGELKVQFANIVGSLNATKIITIGVGGIISFLVGCLWLSLNDQLLTLKNNNIAMTQFLIDSTKDRGQLRVEVEGLKHRVDNLENNCNHSIKE
jgi:hypothetical protein